jgi:hypothetical protein
MAWRFSEKHGAHDKTHPARNRKATGLVSQSLESCRRRLLLLFLLGIALLAGLACFGGFLAARMRASLALGFGLVAAGFRTNGDGAENREGANDGNE